MKTTILSLLLLATLIIASGQEVNIFIASDGEELYYTKYGDGPIVVLLYGGPGYAVSAMKPWADSLLDDFQCILYDQRGTGLSSNQIYVQLIDVKTIKPAHGVIILHQQVNWYPQVDSGFVCLYKRFQPLSLPSGTLYHSTEKRPKMHDSKHKYGISI